MILWNTVLSDPDQLDLTRYLQKLRPMDKAADILALQRRITPALLKAMMADADANLPENMLFVQFKTDRKAKPDEPAPHRSIQSPNFPHGPCPCFI